MTLSTEDVFRLLLDLVEVVETDLDPEEVERAERRVVFVVLLLRIPTSTMTMIAMPGTISVTTMITIERMLLW